MRGYKGMDVDMSCRGFKFELGKTYYAEGGIELCKNGFHFCKELYDVFDYYSTGRYFEIEALGNVLSDGKKSVTSAIKVIRELSSAEINRCKYGNGNGYGYGYGYGYGNGYGDGYGYGYGNGDGYGDGDGDGDGYGDGDGDGNGDGYGDGNGDGNGYGNGYGDFQKIGMYIYKEEIYNGKYLYSM